MSDHIYMIRVAAVLASILSLNVYAQYLPLPPGSEGEPCLEVVKSYLSSSEYNGDENVDKIRQACVEADTRCVRLIGDSLSSSERREAARFLPLVKRCSGRGKADCYSSILESVPSFDRSTAAQASNLLKKCEVGPQ